MSVQRDGEVEVQARLDRLGIDRRWRHHDRSRRHDDRRALVDDASRRFMAPVFVLFDVVAVFAAPVLVTPMIVVVRLGTHRKEDTGTRNRGGQDGLPHKSTHFSLLRQHGMTTACRPNRGGYVSECGATEEMLTDTCQKSDGRSRKSATSKGRMCRMLLPNIGSRLPVEIEKGMALPQNLTRLRKCPRQLAFSEADLRLLINEDARHLRIDLRAFSGG